eukprot:1678273-Pyramimonas_sp.AAC.1
MANGGAWWTPHDSLEDCKAVESLLLENLNEIIDGMDDPETAEKLIACSGRSDMMQFLKVNAGSDGGGTKRLEKL